MKGIIFQEFIMMVETMFSLETADRMMTSSTLETGGAYTSVGTYNHGEIVEMVGHLSVATGVAVPALLHTFGQYLFNSFTVRYPHHIKNVTSTYALLNVLDNKIHVDVKKLYPDAELPIFDVSHADAVVMTLLYRSKRPFADLAEGMIAGAIQHFNESISVTRCDLPCQEGAHTRFTLTRSSHAHPG